MCGERCTITVTNVVEKKLNFLSDSIGGVQSILLSKLPIS